MTIVVENPSASIGEGLVQGAGILGSAIRGISEKRDIERKKQEEIQKNKEYGSVLQSTLASLGPNPSALDFMTALASTQEKGVPLDYAAKYGTLYSTLEKANKQPFGPQQQESLTNLFQKFGQSPDEAQRNAELYGNLTTGGQTEFAKYLVDSIVRGTSPELGSPLPPPKLVQDDITAVDEVQEYQWPEVNIFRGMTPKESANLRKELIKMNSEEIKEIRGKLNSYDRNLSRLNLLENLNDSNKLPQGLEKLNINWTTGDIRFPALANEETQLFVKTINDFTTEAKDTYGARVTNFELGSFMRRLPSLANTPEGRRLIIAQMQNHAKLDRLREDSVNRVYKRYGVQGIDRGTAEQIADELVQQDIKKLKKESSKILQKQENYYAKTVAPEGKMPVRDPSGEIVMIWREDAEKAEKAGFEIL